MLLRSFSVFVVIVCLLSPAAAQDLERIAYDYSGLYERLSPSIVQIQADARTGSGFLIDDEGLIATNHHVVQNTRFLAVRFPDARRVEAKIVRLSPRYDLALIKVHPSFASDAEPLELLPLEEASAIRAGNPVVAFGSPLNQSFLATQGIVSKVQEEVLLGDFLIEPGNSGGPLVDLRGRVLGVNTFGIRNIAGAVRIHLLYQLLANLDRARVAEIEVSSIPLLSRIQKRYPTEVLKQRLLEQEEPDDIENYQFEADKFDVTVITPVLLGKMQVMDDLQRAHNRFKRRGKKIDDPLYQGVDEPFYEWHRSIAPHLDMVVTVKVHPEFGTTTGSKWMSILGAAVGAYNIHQNYEFKAEFYDLKVYRDGVLLEPLHPGRRITDENLQAPLMTFIDEAYSGMYTYDPRDFMTGEKFVFEVYDARKPRKPHKRKKFKADDKLIQSIRADFRGVLDALPE